MLNATLAILDAHVITLNPEKPEAEAIAIYGKEIVAIGSNSEIRRYIGRETKVIDAKGRTVVPGLVDCHAHMTGFGQYLQSLELRNTSSIRQVQTKLGGYAQTHSEKRWILGGRWDEERFSEKRCLTRWDLDAAVKDRPVFLTRVCGHAAVANSKALRLADITKKTKVKNGKIELDEKTGEPNGTLREDALKLVWKVVPRPTAQELELTCLTACENAARAGLTCVHWMVGSAEEIRTLQKLHLEGRLPLRIILGIPAEFLDELAGLGLQMGFGNDLLKIGFVKILADGSLGGHTAALRQPYSDKPDTRGIMLYMQKELNSLVMKAHRVGLQLAVHAIGDRAMETVLTAYEKALRKYPSKDHRHRIEHCSVLNLGLIERMKRSALTASVQPHFAVSDFWIVMRVGEKRARYVYPFRTLMDQGLTLVSGSDSPVEPIDPILGIWAAVARTNPKEESLTAEEALKTYTINAAYASFDEAKRGTIQPGKLADLTILSDDPLKTPSDNIRNIKVHMTLVGGRIVHASRQISTKT